MLAPFGHITWTALIGGALFASSRGGRFHVTRGLVLTILGVVALHALWDQSYRLGGDAHQGARDGRGLGDRVAQRAAVGRSPPPAPT